MKTNKTKPTNYPSRNTLAELAAKRGQLQVCSQSLQSILKNIIASPA